MVAAAPAKMAFRQQVLVGLEIPPTAPVMLLVGSAASTFRDKLTSITAQVYQALSAGGLANGFYND